MSEAFMENSNLKVRIAPPETKVSVDTIVQWIRPRASGLVAIVRRRIDQKRATHKIFKENSHDFRKSFAYRQDPYHWQLEECFHEASTLASPIRLLAGRAGTSEYSLGPSASGPVDQGLVLTAVTNN
ncbi:MAG: hypothetical protein WA757_02955 [Candidatus Acidiferrales bacterium]